MGSLFILVDLRVMPDTNIAIESYLVAIVRICGIPTIEIAYLAIR